MATQRLEFDELTGVLAIMPTPAVPGSSAPDLRESLDIPETYRGARALVDAGVDSVMINGTFGEAATLTTQEWRDFTRTVIDAVDGEVPVIAGPTTLNTRDTIRRAEFASSAGADGLLLGRPMWCRMSEDTTVRYYQHVASAVPELGIIAYYNPTAFKSDFALSLWDRIADIPQVIGAKYMSIDAEDGKFHDIVDTVAGRLRLLPIDFDWARAYRRHPDEASACWSASVSCGPSPVTQVRKQLNEGDFEAAIRMSDRMKAASDPMIPDGDMARFRMYNIPLQKARINAAGFINAGPPRPPYTELPESYEESARAAGRAWHELANSVKS